MSNLKLRCILWLFSLIFHDMCTLSYVSSLTLYAAYSSVNLLPIYVRNSFSIILVYIFMFDYYIHFHHSTIILFIFVAYSFIAYPVHIHLTQLVSWDFGFRFIYQFLTLYFDFVLSIWKNLTKNIESNGKANA